MICFCESCHRFFSENRMVSETQCDQCEAVEYLKKKGGENQKETKLKSKETKGSRCERERVSKSDGRKGQMSLPIMSALDPACQA